MGSLSLSPSLSISSTAIAIFLQINNDFRQVSKNERFSSYYRSSTVHIAIHIDLSLNVNYSSRFIRIFCVPKCSTASDISWPFCVYIKLNAKLTPLIALNEAIEMCAFDCICMCVCVCVVQ